MNVRISIFILVALPTVFAAMQALQRTGFILDNFGVPDTVAGPAGPTHLNSDYSCPTNLTVTSDADSGPGTLRNLINDACERQVITFDTSIHLITLTTGDLIIARGMTIEGPGADKLTISGNHISRVFTVLSRNSEVNLSGLTIRDGKTQDTAKRGGGAILVWPGTTNIMGCLITDNDASLSQDAKGGGIDNEAGVLNLTDCTISNNTARSAGGGVSSLALMLAVVRCTITGNTAGTEGVGGGIYSGLPITLVSCTIYGNSANSGGNMFNVNNPTASNVAFRNTIIAGGKLLGSGGAGPDISGSPFNSGDYNLVENPAGGSITGTIAHNITGVNPNLLPLGNYGGTMPVMLPQPNSPVINTGNINSSIGNIDQRGMPRVSRLVMDIGAVEANYTLSATAGTPQTTGVNTAFPGALQAMLTESGIPIAGAAVKFAAPAAGPGGSFQGSSITRTDTTDAGGIASSNVFTANGDIGSYRVTASIGLAFDDVKYDLTNVTTLPVNFTSITADVSNCAVNIQWETQSETATKDFLIEYSVDGTNFSLLALLPASGNANGIRHYSYAYLPGQPGRHYYRIKQSDYSGAFSYSKVIVADNRCGQLPVLAFPNPVRNKLTITLPPAGTYKLSINDPLGRRINNFHVGGGSHEIDVRSWRTGMYTLAITGIDQKAQVMKIVKD